ncbi:MAG: hypothetical protein GY948_22070 [Alphaproteobacteria bacterium]|nr:hypothetical protein [Alphaproteobacteria bacterium]
MNADTLDTKPNSFGLLAMALAAIGLVVAVIQLSAGPFEAQEPVEKTIAETAVAIKDAAKRAVTGQKAPEPVVVSSGMNIDDMIGIAVIIFAAAGMAMALVALFRKETQTPAYVGFSLGAGVLLMAYLQWIALLICGAIILVAIINNLGDILPS